MMIRFFLWFQQQHELKESFLLFKKIIEKNRKLEQEHDIDHFPVEPYFEENKALNIVGQVLAVIPIKLKRC